MSNGKTRPASRDCIIKRTRAAPFQELLHATTCCSMQHAAVTDDARNYWPHS